MSSAHPHKVSDTMSKIAVSQKGHGNFLSIAMLSDQQGARLTSSARTLSLAFSMAACARLSVCYDLVSSESSERFVRTARLRRPVRRRYRRAPHRRFRNLCWRGRYAKTIRNQGFLGLVLHTPATLHFPNTGVVHTSRTLDGVAEMPQASLQGRRNVPWGEPCPRGECLPHVVFQ